MRYLVYRPRQAVNGGTPERPVFLVQSWGQVEIENDEEEGRD